MVLNLTVHLTEKLLQLTLNLCLHRSITKLTTKVFSHNNLSIGLRKSRTGDTASLNIRIVVDDVFNRRWRDVLTF